MGGPRETTGVALIARPDPACPVTGCSTARISGHSVSIWVLPRRPCGNTLRVSREFRREREVCHCPDMLFLSTVIPEAPKTLHQPPKRIQSVDTEIQTFGCKVVDQPGTSEMSGVWRLGLSRARDSCCAPTGMWDGRLWQESPYSTGGPGASPRDWYRPFDSVMAMEEAQAISRRAVLGGALAGASPLAV